jgi:predicted regulator of Ras-like GTPase activity (Roadblock/LC7/MglB family)
VNFDQAVTELIERCPGAAGAAVFDPDGIPVVVAPKKGKLEGMSAEFAAIVKRLAQAGREFEHGALQQLSVYAENTVVILTSIAAGYFLMMVMDRRGLVGKARFLSRLTSERLYTEFV